MERVRYNTELFLLRDNFWGHFKMMHPLFRYIIIVLPFFIEYDLCFSYVHAFWWYNVL